MKGLAANESQIISALMASSTASSSSPISILISRSTRKSESASGNVNFPERKRHVYRVCATAESEGVGPNPKGPVVDSRIHWENEDEGWLGVDTRKRSSGSSSEEHSSASNSSKQQKQEAERERDLLAEQFADLLNDSSNSHYQ